MKLRKPRWIRFIHELVWQTKMELTAICILTIFTCQSTGMSGQSMKVYLSGGQSNADPEWSQGIEYRMQQEYGSNVLVASPDLDEWNTVFTNYPPTPIACEYSYFEVLDKRFYRIRASK